MVVVSHLFLFLRKSFRGRFDSCESNLPLFGTIYFPTAPNSDKPVAFYSLDVIISVGYCVKSKRGVEFCRRANSVLEQYICMLQIEKYIYFP